MAFKLLPPILEASQPAFIRGESNPYIIHFTLPSALNQSLIGHIQARIVYVVSNKTIVNTSKYPDGIIYKLAAKDSDGTLSSTVFKIETSDLMGEGWVPGSYYKVQLRFGTDNSLSWLDTDSAENFAKWKAAEVAAGNFSEWSTVMLVKPIDQPNIELLNNSLSLINDVNSTSSFVETTSTPLFLGGYSCPTTSNEKLQYYRFVLTDKNDKILEDTDWVLHDIYDSQINANQRFLSEYEASGGKANDPVGLFLQAGGDNIYSLNYKRFNRILVNNEDYKVKFFIKTENEYSNYPNDPAIYSFNVQEQYLNNLQGITIEVDSTSYECTEEGVINVYLSSDNKITGNYVVGRLSELDDYTTVQTMKYVSCFEQKFKRALVFTDFTVESGIKYKYILQQENINGLRSPALWEEGRPAHCVNLEYAYLYADGVQLKLKYDNTMSSFKHTELAAKQDTIGGKYPVIFKNSYAHYAEFPINGTITLNLDENEKFFQYGTDGLYYKKELIIPYDKYTEKVEGYSPKREEGIIDYQEPLTKFTFNTDLTDNNIFIERKFREKAEEFLQSNDYILFRSATEGNIIVSLINVSMTPKDNLGRMIYSFTSTAYEVLDFNIDNLRTYGLIDAGDYVTDLNGEENTLLLGQVSGLFKGVNEPRGKKIFDDEEEVVDFYELIRDENEHLLPSSGTSTVYEYKFVKLKSIWVEQYPKIDFIANKLVLEAEIHSLEGIAYPTDKQLAELAKLKEEYEELLKLEKYIQEQEGAFPQVTLLITPNGETTKEIALGINRIYTVEDIDITSIKLKYSGAFVLNYVCEVDVIESPTEIDLSSTTTVVWDQIAGIFTDTESILNNYDFYRNYIINDRGQWELLPEDQWQLEVANISQYNSGLYQSKNVLDIIKEKTKKDIERMYGTEFTEYNEETSEWTDGEVYYTFGEIVSVEIEADAGVPMTIGAATAPETTVYMSKSEKYVLYPSIGLIDYFSFNDPTYAIINFKCRTIQKTKGVNNAI